MNLIEQGQIDQPIGLFAALLIGLGFGFWLERAGFGSSKKLTAIFYFVDFAVLKVMFSAVVTAAVGLTVLGRFGVVDLSALSIPETSVMRQLVGGVVFGIGFVWGGWCPGTAIVGVAAAKWDAAIFLMGSILGATAFAFIVPQEMPAWYATCTSVLTESTGLSRGLLTVIVVAVALAAFVGAEAIERRRAAKLGGVRS